MLIQNIVSNNVDKSISSENKEKNETEVSILEMCEKVD